MPIFTDVEMGIVKTPDIQTFGFVRTGWGRFSGLMMFDPFVELKRGKYDRFRRCSTPKN